MKKVKLLIQILSLLLVGNIYPQNNWKWISPYPNGNSIHSMAVTGNYTYFLAGMSTVSVSRDGGNTVDNLSVYATPNDVGYAGSFQQRISFSDSLTGILLDPFGGEFRTTDGGHTWNAMKRGYDAYVVSFANSRTGWEMSAQGFFKTTNAGLTWNKQAFPWQNPAEGLNRIYAPDSLNVWVLSAYFYTPERGGNIYFSSNGGSSWAIQKTGLPSDTLRQLSLEDIKINKSGIGILAASYYEKHSPTPWINRSVIMRTTDSGKTWSVIDSTISGNLSSVLSINDSIWVIHGTGKESSNMTIQMRSSDYGKSFDNRNILIPTFSNQFFRTSAYSPQTKTIFVSTIFDGLFRSTDLGLTYSKVTSDNDMRINDFSLDNSKSDQQLAAAFQYGASSFLLSEDGGRTWSRKVPKTNEFQTSITGVYIIDGVINLFTFFNIYKSNDHGNTWASEASIPQLNSRLHFSAYSSNLFTAISDESFPKIYYSSDGGRRWVRSPFALNYAFSTLRMTGPEEVIGCGSRWDSTGNSGFIFTSSNGGTSWRIVQNNESLKDIFMTSKTTGYSYSDNKLYITKDNWKSRQEIYNTSNSDIQAVVFKDSLHGLMRNNNSFSETNDGGYDWIKNNLEMPMTNIIRKMAYNNQGDLLVLGDAGFIINLSNKNDQALKDQTGNAAINKFELFQNYPNPFNPVTQISFTLPERVSVELKVYDIIGREVRTLLSEVKEAGRYSVPFNSEGLPSGIYIYKLKAGSQIFTRKMMMVK